MLMLFSKWFSCKRVVVEVQKLALALSDIRADKNRTEVFKHSEKVL